MTPPTSKKDYSITLKLVALGDKVRDRTTPASHIRQQIEQIQGMAPDVGQTYSLAVYALGVRWHSKVDELLCGLKLDDGKITYLATVAGANDDGMVAILTKYFAPARPWIYQALFVEGVELLHACLSAGIDLPLPPDSSLRSSAGAQPWRDDMHNKDVNALAKLAAREDTRHAEIWLANSQVAKEWLPQLLTLAARGSIAMLSFLHEKLERPPSDVNLLFNAVLAGNPATAGWLAKRPGVFAEFMRKHGQSGWPLGRLLPVEFSLELREEIKSKAGRAQWLGHVAKGGNVDAVAQYLKDRPDVVAELLTVRALTPASLLNSYNRHRTPLIKAMIEAMPPEQLAPMVRGISHVTLLHDVGYDTTRIIQHLNTDSLQATAMDKLMA